MFVKSRVRKQGRGFSLVEAVIVSALVVTVFGGLFAGLQLMVSIIGNSKAEAGARALAVSRMEYIRSLPYSDVGTEFGIPSGDLPQTSTTTLNDINYTESLLVQYVDRPEDGFGVSDENGINADSKVVKVEYSWEHRGKNHSFVLISDLIPKGIESTSGGGTLFINVFDASVQPVSGADVHIFNDSVATNTIDVTVSTNASGIANFPGAPARSGYQVTVTKSGYSTDQTYSATSENPSPNPPHVSVLEGEVSTVNFAIDLLSDLTIRTIGTPVTNLFSDSFSSDVQIAEFASTTISSGSIVLTDIGGAYDSEGYLYSTTTSPSTISSWQIFDFDTSVATSTEARISLYSVSGGSTYALVPDNVLNGNSTGFVSGPVDISGVNPVSYPALALRANLSTSDDNETPYLNDWQLSYIESETPISDITLDIIGSKDIGTNSGQPVWKYTNTATTDGSGEILLTDLEWDAYDIVIDGVGEGYDLKEAYSPIPYALNPGVSEILTLVMESHTDYSLRTSVVNTSGSPVIGATAHLSNGSYDVSQDTSIYGQTFFTGMSSSSDYTLEVSAVGYDPDTQSNVSITDNTSIVVILPDEGTVIEPPPEEEATSTTSTFLSGYTKRIPLSISGSTLFGNVSSFPVYLDLSLLPSAFFASVNSDGGDIRITEEDGITEVPREIVDVDTSAQTGEVHFKAPSLSISTTTNFYIYYGNSSATDYSAGDTYGSNNVWSNSYLAVYHFEEGQSGTGHANEYRDATSNGYDGDDYVAASGKTGKLGLGQQFSSSNQDYIELPYTLLDNRQNVTVSNWYRTQSNGPHPFLSGANNSDDNEFLNWVLSDSQFELWNHGSRATWNLSFDIDDNVWRYYTWVRDDTSNQIVGYINTNAASGNRSLHTLDIDPGGLFIGQDQDYVGGGFDSGQELNGYLDEMRISSVARGSGWVANAYLNQNSPASFYTIGSIETE